MSVIAVLPISCSLMVRRRHYAGSPVEAERHNGPETSTSSSAVAKRPRDASCLSVVNFNSTKR